MKPHVKTPNTYLILLRTIGLLAVVLLTSFNAQAQLRIVGAISGTVQDPTGAVVSNAKVTLRDEKTSPRAVGAGCRRCGNSDCQSASIHWIGVDLSMSVQILEFFPPQCAGDVNLPQHDSLGSNHQPGALPSSRSAHGTPNRTG